MGAGRAGGWVGYVGWAGLGANAGAAVHVWRTTPLVPQPAPAGAPLAQYQPPGVAAPPPSPQVYRMLIKNNIPVPNHIIVDREGIPEGEHPPGWVEEVRVNTSVGLGAWRSCGHGALGGGGGNQSYKRHLGGGGEGIGWWRCGHSILFALTSSTQCSLAPLPQAAGWRRVLPLCRLLVGGGSCPCVLCC